MVEVGVINDGSMAIKVAAGANVVSKKSRKSGGFLKSYKSFSFVLKKLFPPLNAILPLSIHFLTPCYCLRFVIQVCHDLFNAVFLVRL